jgi:uncharacterized Ntn-hydrolase superfamily protein
MTYSIVARDRSTGQLGVAVQTCMFAVGSIVPWARAGVGAVATQAIGEPAYGPRCLDAMAAGRSAAEALAAAQEADPMSFLRQVGVVGADGSVATLTGTLCIDHAGHQTGDGYSVQANMMSSPEVWAAMAFAFEATSGRLARRMLAALMAGEAAGGDARGRMSAALLVVDGAAPAQPAAEAVVDLRVDRSTDPLGELSRLLDAADAFAAYGRAVDQLMSGDATAALQSVDDGLRILPGEANIRFLRSGALLASGQVDAAAAELRALVAAQPSWEVVVRSFAAKGLIAVPDGASIDSILG